MSLILTLVTDSRAVEEVETKDSDKLKLTMLTVSDKMVENTSSSLFITRRSGSALFLILCFSILPTSALTSDIADQSGKVGKVLIRFIKKCRIFRRF